VTLAADPDDLFSWKPPIRLGSVADGITFDTRRDGKRLNDQMRRVFEIVRDGKWHTLHELHAITGYPEASISARLRDMRKPKILGATVEREYLGSGLWQYRVTL
jgi:hypothetical protein